jgi:hypothetical protein
MITKKILESSRFQDLFLLRYRYIVIPLYRYYDCVLLHQIGTALHLFEHCLSDSA